MTPRDLWERYKALLFDDPGLGVRLDLSRAGLGDGALAEREAAVQRALAAMEALERGAIANPDEKRMVGHYWLRAPELAPDAGDRRAPSSTLARVVDFAARVHAGRSARRAPSASRHLLVDRHRRLGARAAVRGRRARRRRATGCARTSSTTPIPTASTGCSAALGDALAETLTVVISKSGGTQETRNGMLEARRPTARAGSSSAPTRWR